jgi:hypothetical protein
LIQEDTNNTNRSIASNEIGMVIKKPLTKKSPEPDRLTAEFYELF